MNKRFLTSAEARRFYDHFGARQDKQGFYENAALQSVLDDFNFNGTTHLVEAGCGTGRFAARLLNQVLPASAPYIGMDISPTMLALSREKLKAHAERCLLIRCDLLRAMPLASQSTDTLISAYTLDLIADDVLPGVVTEAARIVKPGGHLIVVNITQGTTMPQKLVNAVWDKVFRLAPAKLGGCRALDITEYLTADRWSLVSVKRVAAFGIASQVCIARRL